MRRVLAAACIMLGLLAGPALSHEDKLAGIDWVLEGQTGPRAPFLRFDGGRVGGLGGCNRFGARYEQRGDRLTFSPLMATRMACKPEVMKAEQAFFDTLAQVKGMRLEGDRLELLDGSGKVIATLVKRVAE